MATPLVLAQLNGDLTYADGGAGGTATGVGALRWRTGWVAGKQAAFLEEGTTNLVPNPRAAVDTASTVRYGQTAAVTRDVRSLGPDLPTAFKSTRGVGETDGSCGFEVNLAAGSATTGLPYMATRTCLDDVGGRQYRLWYRWITSGGAIINDVQGTVVTSVAGQAFTLVAGGTAPATTSAIRFEVFQSGIPSAADGEAHWDSGLQIEQKDHATSYCDGAMGAGYSWTGTAHNSASVRAAAAVAIPCAAPGSVACRYSEDGGATWAFGYVTTLTGTNLGTAGKVSHDGSNLVIASDRQLLVGPVYAFADTLSPYQQSNLSEATAWTYGMPLEPQPNGALTVLPVVGTNSAAPVIAVP